MRAALVTGFVLFTAVLVAPRWSDSATGGVDTLPTEYAAFVMELEISAGSELTRAVFTYDSADKWLYEVFQADSEVLIRSQELRDGEVIVHRAEFGEEVFPAGSDATIPVAWFIDSGTMRGRGAVRLGSDTTFELRGTLACDAEVRDTVCGGKSSVDVVTRAEYDEASGIPTGFTESIDGKVVSTVVATSLILR